MFFMNIEIINNKHYIIKKWRGLRKPTMAKPISRDAKPERRNVFPFTQDVGQN